MSVQSRAQNLIELYGFNGARIRGRLDHELVAEIDRCEQDSFAQVPSVTEQRQQPIQYPSNHVSKGII